MAIEITHALLEAISNPFALQILIYLLQKGEAKLSDILVFITGFSRYKSVRKTLLKLEAVGLINRKIISWGRAQKWVITLTEMGEKLAKSISAVLKLFIKEK